jgi:hypothetical protein
MEDSAGSLYLFKLVATSNRSKEIQRMSSQPKPAHIKSESLYDQVPELPAPRFVKIPSFFKLTL